MKHVIVIETLDKDCGGREIDPELGRFIDSGVERAILNTRGQNCCIYSKYDVSSALAALHELYGVPNCQHPEGV